ncbi:MAG: pallilysin-related adhesin [Treponema sp.]|nr:pallilysin-related adhesin [Treponema sp.]
MKKELFGLYIGILVFCVLLIIFLATGLWKVVFYPASNDDVRTRIITPREANTFAASDTTDYFLWEEKLETKLPMENGEIVIAVLNRESEVYIGEEQFVIYRDSDPAVPIHITFFGYDDRARSYRRMWSLPTAAVRAETATISSFDLIGDRNNCIIVTGMNTNNEHTITILRRGANYMPGQPYRKIAEMQVAGSIVIQETLRSLAYQQNMTRGQSFNIAAYGHDSSSANILDQIETIYSYNPAREQYEQIQVSRIPGSQIEQRRLRELLSGRPGVFENFINDLWYFISPQGTIDTSQYLYFDPAKKEIIFFGDETQQVFRWQTSSPTRFGLNIRSQNISISTLLRFVNIELESLDRIRLSVVEDVRLKIAVSNTWDGSYRRAGAVNIRETLSQVRPGTDAVYDSSWGRVQFNSSGEYTISAGGSTRKGRYVFYKVNSNDLLEMRPEDGEENRLVYRIENTAAGAMVLSRVRLGTQGVQDLLEPPITLTLVN